MTFLCDENDMRLGDLFTGSFLPNPDISSSGPWGVFSWATGRMARAGKGLLHQDHVTTISPIADLLPEGYTKVSGIEFAQKGLDNHEIVDTYIKDNTWIAFDLSNGTRLDFAVFSLDMGAQEQIDLTVEFIKVSAKPVPKPTDDHILTNFWRMTHDGPASQQRKLLVPEWKEIAQNYSSQAQKQLDLLNKMESADSQGGNIVVLHGPAGTGKTTALRALARSWKSWADVHYVIDPDQFLAQADYMWKTVLSITDETDVKWKLLIMEDADELIRENAKDRVGQAFSRLLNLGDGFLGQGLRLLIVLTTNEPVNKLAPAITRPGRCLAHIEVPRLGAVEATKWLQSNGGIGMGVAVSTTLAELYEKLASNPQMVAEKFTERPGQYL